MASQSNSNFRLAIELIEQRELCLKITLASVDDLMVCNWSCDSKEIHFIVL